MKATIGLGCGDEGKGIFTDYLCSKNPNHIVVRFSGGHNAGHTVCLKNDRHVFSNFGSGTLRGNKTYWHKNCLVDPMGLMNEYCNLREKNINPVIYINNRCIVVTPYDKKANQEDVNNIKHGTCGVGLGTTKKRNEDRYTLYYEDLFNDTIFDIKLKLIAEYYNKKYNRDIEYMWAIHHIRKLNNIISVDEYPKGKYIFEGSQGLLLDENIGFFPHVTRSNLLDIDKKIDTVYLVTRAYQTRHGNGPMTNEKIPHNIVKNPQETNIKNYQGEFRRSLLDIDLLKYSISKTKHIKNRILVITCLDHIKNDYRFTIEGQIINYSNKDLFINRISKILGIKKVYISETPYSENIYKWKWKR